MRYPLLGVSVLTLLSGCGWFDSSTPSNTAKVRPGADRQVPAGSSLPSAGGAHQYESAIAPVDETRNGPKIGSLVPDKGGQKMQLEAAAKEAAEHDKQAREAREKAAQEVAERKAKEPTEAKPPRVSKESTRGAEPPTQPSVPSYAPVTSTPAAPPPSPPQVAPSTGSASRLEPIAAATPPPLPADPNKAFSPPPGWVPPVQAQPVNQPDQASTTSQPTPAVTKKAAASSTPVMPPSAPTSEIFATLAPTPPAQMDAIAPVRPDPNKAFEPPPGWIPPGQTASAPTPPALSPSAAAALAPPLQRAPVVKEPALTPASPARSANPNKAVEPPVAWTPPARGVAPLPGQTAAAAPAPPPPMPVAEPTPAPPAGPDSAFGTPDEQGESVLAATTLVRRGAAPTPASPILVAPSPPANMTAASVAPRARAPNLGSPPPIATVFFARQSADITDDGKVELARIAKSLQRVRQLELHGFAGDDDPVNDRKVALARALAVRSHLIDLGVTPNIELIIATLPRRSDGTTEHVDIVIPRE